MLGAIAGDIIGSVYEHQPTKEYNFRLYSPASCYTDDTVLTVAVADAVLHNQDYGETIKNYGRQYPNAGYGGLFQQWLQRSDRQPYHSWGNGAAMRVSPVGFAFDSEERVLAEAEKTAAVTHDHPEGIKGAQATALAVYLARQGIPKTKLKQHLTDKFGYDLERSSADIRPRYRFYVSCQKTVPAAIIAFLDARDFEDAIRISISLGGDADTMGSITGGIAQAYYQKIASQIQRETYNRLPQEFIAVIREFNRTYQVKI